MPQNPSQPNAYNPQPYYGNIGGLNRLAAMGAQAGSPYFSFTGRPNVNQGDVLSALQQQFGGYGGGGGGMFPGLTRRGMYASGATSSESAPWMGGSDYGGGGPNDKSLAWNDPMSPWYGNQRGYREYSTNQGTTAALGAQRTLEAMQHPGMEFDPTTGKWKVPGSIYNPLTQSWTPPSPGGRQLPPGPGQGGR
jgi:hypothetical protein